MVVTGQHFLTWEGAPERRGGAGLCSFRPSSGGLLFGCTAAAGGFGKRILELAATAAFGFEVRRRPRLVAVIARGAKSHAEASPACPGPGVADDSWNGQEENPGLLVLQSSGGTWPLPYFSPLGWLPMDTHFLCCVFSFYVEMLISTGHFSWTWPHAFDLFLLAWVNLPLSEFELLRAPAVNFPTGWATCRKAIAGAFRCCC